MLRSQKAQLVHDWNRKYIPGQKIKVKINGSDVITRTKSPAELLSGATPVIQIQAQGGFFALDTVTAIK